MSEVKTGLVLEGGAMRGIFSAGCRGTADNIYDIRL